MTTAGPGDPHEAALNVHAYDQVLADYKETYPGHSTEWYHAMMLRMKHYRDHGGDMEGAPDLPDE